MAPSPGGTPTSPSDIEDWIVTRVEPGVDAVPLEPETTEIPYFTTEPEKQTEWEPAYTPLGTSPSPGECSWSLGHALKHAHYPTLLPAMECPGEGGVWGGWGSNSLYSPGKP